jgi:hypothetical protein
VSHSCLPSQTTPSKLSSPLNFALCPFPDQIERDAEKMSTPSRRSTRNSATPRSTRSSQPRSSPAPAGPSNEGDEPVATPRQRQTRASQLASSPLFYQSSSPGNGLPNPSSPLRQMSNTQSTANGNAPSSPLRQQSGTQTDGERTPRASGHLIGGRLYRPHYFYSWKILTSSRVVSYPLRPELQPRAQPHPALRLAQ